MASDYCFGCSIIEHTNINDLSSDDVISADVSFLDIDVVVVVDDDLLCSD